MSNPVVLTGYGVVGDLGGSLDPMAVQKSLRHRKSWKVMDGRTRLAMAAAMQAIRRAALTPVGSEGGVALGVGWAGPDEELMASLTSRCAEKAQAGQWMELLQKELPPLWLLERLPNMPASHLAIQFQAEGPCHTNAAVRAAGLQALSLAAGWVGSGEVSWALAGGVEGPLGILGAKAWVEMWPEVAHQEGAALFVLENREHALARGAVILAEVSLDFSKSPGLARGAGALGGMKALLDGLEGGRESSTIFSLPAEADRALRLEVPA